MFALDRFFHQDDVTATIIIVHTKGDFFFNTFPYYNQLCFVILKKSGSYNNQKF